MKGIVFLFLALLTVSSGYAFDKSLLAELVAGEIKNSAIDKEVQIGQIKFTGFEPKGNCIPEDLKIREIKRPSSVLFTFYCGKTFYSAIANYEILTKLYVTQRPLKRGDIINEEDIMEIKQPLGRMPSGAVTDKNLIIGRTVKRTLARGLIIKEEHLYQGIPVKKGSRVNLIINTGQITVMAEGILKSDSVIGGAARVKCFPTGKEIEGKLIDRDKVRVLL